MDFQQFVQSLSQQSPPDMEPMLISLWYDHKGDWDGAHNIVQDINGSMACKIHGYLHRKEGDLSNAGYWYSRAGSTTPSVDLDTEWEQLVKELL